MHAVYVWITRKSSQAIFNIKTEKGYIGTSSEATLWAYGTTAGLSQGDYKNWFLAINGDPQNMIGKPMSLFLVKDKKYYDLVFNSYTGAGAGGGFSYTRKEIKPSWLNFSSNSGSVSANSEANLTLTLDGTALDGIYSYDFVLKSNDPSVPEIKVPVTFIVGAAIVKNPVADIRINHGFIKSELEIDTVFDSGASLSIQAFSSDTAVVRVKTQGDTLLTVTEVAAGNAVISLRATDVNGKATYDDFNFIVNKGPIVSKSLNNIKKNIGFSSEVIDLSTYFTDVNNDPVTYSAVIKNTGVAGVSVNGNLLTITEVAPGTAEIVVSAIDAFDPLVAKDSFVFAVNRVPVVANPIADILINNGFVSKRIELANVFTDVDADILTYAVTSSDTIIAEAVISAGAIVITETGSGIVSITVTANDGYEGIVSDVFTLTVNNIPTVENILTDILINSDFTIYDIVITDLFSDKDADALTITAISNNENVVTVSLTGNTLSINETGAGVAVITITASDSKGGIIAHSFKFTVNTIPYAIPLSDIIVNEGFEKMEFDMTYMFEDSDADTLIFTAVSSNTDVATCYVNGKNLSIIGASETGTITILLTANDGKGGEASSSLNFIVNDLPVADKFEDLILKQGFVNKKIDLTPYFTDAQKLTYSVESADTNVVTCTISGKILTITELGLGTSVITVSAADIYGSSISGSFNLTVESSVNVESGTLHLLSMYPNPASDYLTLGSQSVINGSVRIITLSGAVVLRQEAVANEGKIVINLSGIEKGAYFVQIIDNSKVVFNQKLIVK